MGIRSREVIITREPLKVHQLYEDDWMDYKGYAKLFGCLQYVTRGWFDRGLKHVTRGKNKYAQVKDVIDYIAGGHA